jgi:uncharacterized protein YkwD
MVRADRSCMGRLFGRFAVIAAAVAVIGAVGVGASAATAAVDSSRTVSAQDRLESQILATLNAARRARGLKPLRLSAALSTAADGHSRSMATYGFFSHASRDGRTLAHRVRNYGRGSRWLAGENLLWASPTLEASEALQMWMDSPGHRKNMLEPRWREVGLSAVSVPVAPGVFGGLTVVIVTADFGVRW